MVFGFLWVIASAITAFLPMRRQMVPGLALLLVAPVLLWFIARDYGIWVFLITLLAALSMFRNPFIYFARRAMGLPVSLPKDSQPKADVTPPETGQ